MRTESRKVTVTAEGDSRQMIEGVSDNDGKKIQERDSIRFSVPVLPVTRMTEACPSENRYPIER